MISQIILLVQNKVNINIQIFSHKFADYTLYELRNIFFYRFVAGCKKNIYKFFKYLLTGNKKNIWDSVLTTKLSMIVQKKSVYKTAILLAYFEGGSRSREQPEERIWGASVFLKSAVNVAIIVG